MVVSDLLPVAQSYVPKRANASWSVTCPGRKSSSLRTFLSKGTILVHLKPDLIVLGAAVLSQVCMHMAASHRSSEFGLDDSTSKRCPIIEESFKDFKDRSV